MALPLWPARHLLRCAVHPRHSLPPRSEEGLIDLEHSAHVGIRGSLCSTLDLDESEALGFTTVHARDFIRHPTDDLVGVDVV
jgi:hypothetical protein